jgi:hypothetical protein
MRQQNLIEDLKIEGIIGKVKQMKVNVKKVKLNRLGLLVLVSKGEQKIITMNLPEI